MVTCSPRCPTTHADSADAIEEKFIPKVESPPKGAKHEMVNDSTYAFKCGACGLEWTEAWGSMDDIGGMDPMPGEDLDCLHCGTELPLKAWDEDYTEEFCYGDDDDDDDDG